MLTAGPSDAPWVTKESTAVFLANTNRYSEALSIFAGVASPLSPHMTAVKSLCLYETGDYTAALDLLLSAEKRGFGTPELSLTKGKCLYRLSEFETAKYAFEACQSVFPTAETELWIQRCVARIALASTAFFSRLIRYESPPREPDPPLGGAHPSDAIPNCSDFPI
jgi:hypothetical protein